MVREADICRVTEPDCPTKLNALVNRGRSPSNVIKDSGKMGDGFEHVQPFIDSLPNSLTGQQRQIAVDLIKRNADVFSKSKFDLGHTKLVQHQIDTWSREPFKELL